MTSVKAYTDHPVAVPAAGEPHVAVLAGKLMPEDAGLWTARRGYCTRAHAIGRAEAALIALYGIRTFHAIARGVAA